MEDSTQNTSPWLESYIRKLVSEAFEHFVKPGPESVAAFPMEDSTQNTSPWLESYIRKLVCEAFEHFVMAGPASVAAFLMKDSTQNTSPWLESYTRKLVSEAFEHFVKSGTAMVGGRWISHNYGVKCEGGGARRTEMASLDSKFEDLSVKEPVD